MRSQVIKIRHMGWVNPQLDLSSWFNLKFRIPSVILSRPRNVTTIVPDNHTLHPNWCRLIQSWDSIHILKLVIVGGRGVIPS